MFWEISLKQFGKLITEKTCPQLYEHDICDRLLSCVHWGLLVTKAKYVRCVPLCYQHSNLDICHNQTFHALEGKLLFGSVLWLVVLLGYLFTNMKYFVVLSDTNTQHILEIRQKPPKHTPCYYKHIAVLGSCVCINVTSHTTHIVSVFTLLSVLTAVLIP